MAIPVTIVTGFLGVGKTTAILDAFARVRPPGERWAVLVNEFGEVGIDGAILEGADGLAVAEIPGGCICCTAGPLLMHQLARLIDTARPDRLFIEPTGLASPAQVVDMLRRPWFADTLALRAVITLVDPARFLTPDDAQPDTFLAQVEAADVLVANRADQHDASTLDAFRAKAASLWPPKAVVAVTARGRLDGAWLDLDPTPDRPMREVHHDDPHDHDHGHDHDHDHGHDHADAHDHGRPFAHVAAGVATCGWVFPPDVVFDPGRLQATLQDLARPGDRLPHGVLRLKGIFHAGNAWGLVQGTATELSYGPTQHRRDSRVEIIAPAEPPPDWDAVEAAWEAARRA